VQHYIHKLCECGAAVAALVVQDSAEGNLLGFETGRKWWPCTVHKHLAKDLDKFQKEEGSTKQKVTVEDFERVKKQFLQDNVDITTMKDINP